MSIRDDYKAMEQSYMVLRDQYSEIARALGFKGVSLWDDPVEDHDTIVARASRTGEASAVVAMEAFPIRESESDADYLARVTDWWTRKGFKHLAAARKVC